MIRRLWTGITGRWAALPGKTGVWCLLLLFCVPILIVSCATIDMKYVIPPTIPGAEFVGMDGCADCHEKEAKNFARAKHARIHVKDGELAGLSGCESCHGPGSKHVDADDKDKKATIVNPGKSSSECFRCHFDKEAEFNLPHRHPVVEGKMTCSDCHDPHGPDSKKPAGLAITRVNDACAECHREQARPHIYQHEALRDGCTVCHDVHGSINKKMLVQNDANLCLQCHAQVPTASGKIQIGGRDHTSFLSRGTCWSAGCHTGLHGSNIDSHLRY